MKVVLIVHYFPPINVSGTRKVLALSKYLTRFGHQVTVITTAKKKFDGPPLEAMPDYCRIIEVGGKSPAPILQASSMQENVVSGARTGIVWKLVLFRRALTQLFGQLIDHRIFFAFRFRLGLIPPEAKGALREADIVMSSCPPWPVHMAGYFVKKLYKKPWIAEYRDQFSGYHYIAGSRFSAVIEKWLDKRLLSRADRVTTISEPMSQYYRHFHSQVITIENGYDQDFIDAARAKLPAASAKSEHVVIRYLGSITRDRIPRGLFTALRNLESSVRNRISIEIYGESKLLFEAIENECPDLKSLFYFHDRVSYSDSIRLMLTADALLIMETSSQGSLSTQGTLTTKLFEYLAVERPIIAEISPQTLIGKIIQKSQVDLVVSDVPVDIEAALRKLLSGSAKINPQHTFIRSFSREVQARRFEELCVDIIKNQVNKHG